MAFVPSINTCVKTACSVLTFRDTTGAYNVSTNPTGYGTPNPAVGDFVSATLVIIAPDETEYTLDLIALAAGFPTSNVDFEYTIPSAQIGNRTNIEDGYWQFIYTIDTDDEQFIASKVTIFSCNTGCCVRALLVDIDPALTNNKINDKKISEYKRVSAFYDSLKYSAFCLNIDKFLNIKSIIDKICAKSNCKTCN